MRVRGQPRQGTFFVTAAAVTPPTATVHLMAPQTRLDDSCHIQPNRSAAGRHLTCGDTQDTPRQMSVGSAQRWDGSCHCRQAPCSRWFSLITRPRDHGARTPSISSNIYVGPVHSSGGSWRCIFVQLPRFDLDWTDWFGRLKIG